MRSSYFPSAGWTQPHPRCASVPHPCAAWGSPDQTPALTRPRPGAAGFGLFKVVTGPTVVTTLSISLVWLIYTAIPPYLLLHYHFVGRGQTLRWACRICFWLSSLAGIAAIVLLWLVYPKQVPAPPPNPNPICSPLPRLTSPSGALPAMRADPLCSLQCGACAVASRAARAVAVPASAPAASRPARTPS